MRVLSLALIAALLVAFVLCNVEAQQNFRKLPKLLVRKNSFTVSGISSGAYMAQQFAVAFSKTVSGTGVVAGGPYFVSF